MELVSDHDRRINIEDLERMFPLIDAEDRLRYACDHPHGDFDLPQVRQSRGEA